MLLQLSFTVTEPIKAKSPKITYADLYQLAGVVAVEVTGGPTVEFIPGRRDSSVCPREGRLPDAKKGNCHKLFFELVYLFFCHYNHAS
jgi:L-ascorbate peroxidase